MDRSPLESTDALAEALAEIVGHRGVLLDDDLRASFEEDWTGRFRGRARLVVRPADADQVAAVVACCARHGAALVPQGGNTGLVGGGVPRGGEVVLSLRRLDRLEPVDAASGHVVAGAGVTLARLQQHAAAAGFDAGVDFAARDSATVGGMVATDAGGTYALRHGTVRARVAGLRAVLADGSVVERMSGVMKDNAGYALPALIVGSEGTLAVVTAVRWRLVARELARAVALVPLPSLTAAGELLARLRRTQPGLVACDFLLDDGLALVLDHLGVASPLSRRAAAYVFVEVAGRLAPGEELAEALQQAGVADAVLADDTSGRARLWRLRERMSEAVAAAGVPHKLDVGVPLERLATFAERVPAVVAAVAPAARVLLFGHLGDGNVHVNILGVDPDDARVDEAVLRVVSACGGTISAEHGVGVAKARWLGLTRSSAEIAAMVAVKRALDPDGLLNPGVVLSGTPGSP
ncbi:MAG TPA: FAD-binding oxidoreductase [Conexibacter sp.]|nr:FAD-binding oxidoreductase [Conexibacter sp.]